MKDLIIEIAEALKIGDISVYEAASKLSYAIIIPEVCLNKKDFSLEATDYEIVKLLRSGIIIYEGDRMSVNLKVLEIFQRELKS
jgi:hypothetical protein